MTGDVKSVETMLKVQGERVLVHWEEEDDSGILVSTFVHVVDVNGRQLRLVNKEDRNGQPDWAVSQKLLESIEPAPSNAHQARWQLRINLC